MDSCPISGKHCGEPKNCDSKISSNKVCQVCEVLCEWNQLISEHYTLLNSLKKINLAACPKCGITPDQIKKIGRLGCSNCYIYYSISLETLIKKSQNNQTEHVGKIPKNKFKHQQRKAHNLEINAEINRLEEKIKKAVLVENYEAAHDLKKQIEKLKTSLT